MEKNKAFNEFTLNLGMLLGSLTNQQIKDSLKEIGASDKDIKDLEAILIKIGRIFYK